MEIKRLSLLPENAQDFVDEGTEGIRRLYGAAAAAYYAEVGLENFRMAVAHATILALGAFEGTRAVGMFLAVRRVPAAHISYIHVLRGYEGRGIEQDLLEEALAELKRDEFEHIACEYVPMCRLDLADVFAAHGFECVARRLMIAPLDHPALTRSDVGRCVPYGVADWDEVAQCLVDAYVDNPGRRLHIDVTDKALAFGFVTRVAAGNFGKVRPGYGQAVMYGYRCAGVVLGCEAAPDLGFVLQVAVRLEYRRRGLAMLLIQNVAEAFRESGLKRMALGVTDGNPARCLYERLGFRTLRPMDVYFWWRPGCDPGFGADKAAPREERD